jgi:hypothetical protein
MKSQHWSILFLTETCSKTSQHYVSEGFHVYTSGSTEDPFAEVAALLAPHILPFVHAIRTHTARILEVQLIPSPTHHIRTSIYRPDNRTSQRTNHGGVVATPVWGESSPLKRFTMQHMSEP